MPDFSRYAKHKLVPTM